MAELRKDRRVTQALLELLPKGIVGVSMALAAADAGATTLARGAAGLKDIKVTP